MHFDILTIFPGMFEGPFSHGIIRIAKEKKIVSIGLRDLRDFTDDPHRKVDDYPYGGGPGMVLKAEPIFDAVKSVRENDAKVILLSPQGETYTQAIAQQLANEPRLIFICGRYQGVDERVREALVDTELSIGNYVLSGGELACMVIVESIVRLLPGALNNPESASSDSLGCLDSPLYTRPREFRGMKVPEVLLSGDHQEIKEWRDKRKHKWQQLTK
jgi:tRNA (guanine37-N1)-methyltransferase